MPRQLRTETFIAAPPATVWAILVDFPAHAAWNPFMASIAGEAREGARLDVAFRNGWAMRPTVTRVEPGRALEWFGKLAFGGLFDGRHRFELIEEAGGTRLVHSEAFTGLLVPFTGGLLADTEKGFTAFNEAIKARAEALALAA